jgi:hypothetical protein
MLRELLAPIEWDSMDITGLTWPTLTLTMSGPLLSCGYVRHCYAQIFGIEPATLHLLCSGYCKPDDDAEYAYDGLLAYSCDTPTGAPATTSLV